MHFANFHQFLHMGGYASDVWSAYGIAAVFLIYHLIVALWPNRHAPTA